MKFRFFILLITLIVFLNISSAQVSRKVIKLGTNHPAETPVVKGLEKFIELVNKKSQGKIKVNLFPNGVLGSDQANISSIQGGTLEMSVMNSSIFSSLVKDFTVFDLPFLFDNVKEVDALIESQVAKDLHVKLEIKGIIGLAYFDNGFRVITNSKRPINKVEDFKGLKLRVIPNPIDVELINTLGANATPLPVPELFPALEQKAVDGNTGYSIMNLPVYKMYEVQKYLTLSHHIYNIQSLIISKKFWDKLSNEEKEIISEAAIESSKFQRDLSRKMEAETLEFLKKQGMEVSSFSDAEKKVLSGKIRKITEKYTKIISNKTISLIQEELNKVRASDF